MLGRCPRPGLHNWGVVVVAGHSVQLEEEGNGDSSQTSVRQKRPGGGPGNPGVLSRRGHLCDFPCGGLQAHGLGPDS